MPRKRIEVNKRELAATIGNVEQDNAFATRNDLAIAVSEKMGITPSVVLLRIKEFGIEPKTPKGKRGRQAGVKLTAEQKAAMQAGRKKKKEFNVDEMRKTFPVSYSGLLDKVSKGSLASTIKAKCLDCVQFHKPEITNCTCVSCPLYHVRPYQKKN